MNMESRSSLDIRKILGLRDSAVVRMSNIEGNQVHTYYKNGL
ncbi:hypothetical protein BH18THE2_BH18THE2_09450 [soil metagenome]